MRFGIYDNFGARNSRPVFAALRHGLDTLGLPHAPHDISADVAVIWSVVWAGRMRENRQVWQYFRSLGRPVIVLEVGMLRRGQTWKIAVNGTGSHAHQGYGTEPDRPEKLGINVLPWRDAGDQVVVCTQRTDSLQWQGLPNPTIWLTNLRDQLRLHTQRPLILRPHPRQRIDRCQGYTIHPPKPMSGTYDDFDLDRGLSAAWAVINHNSGPGIQAVLQGIPAFVDESSLAAPVANLDIAMIESPARPDRDAWLMQLCHTEWLLEEIATGWPIERILSQL